VSFSGGSKGFRMEFVLSVSSEESDLRYLEYGMATLNCNVGSDGGENRLLLHHSLHTPRMLQPQHSHIQTSVVTVTSFVRSPLIYWCYSSRSYLLISFAIPHPSLGKRRRLRSSATEFTFLHPFMVD
jgi:hypothetical protein